MFLDGRGKYIAHSLTTDPLNAIQQKNRCDRKTAVSILNHPSYPLSQVNKFLSEEFFAFWFCLSLLHCRNVETVDKPAPPAPILKQRAKKGIPYIQYKTLEVTPLRAVRQGGTRKDGTPEPKALHFVRGHFKDFSDKGLFGKYIAGLG